MAAPVIQSTGTGSSSSSSSVSISKPSGLASGDLCLVVIHGFNPSASPAANAKTGWTLLSEIWHSGFYEYIAAYYRIADGTEGASESFTFTNSAHELIGRWFRISGADTSNPVNVSSFSTSGSAEEPAVPSVTTTVDDCLHIGAFTESNTTGYPHTCDQTLIYTGAGSYSGFGAGYQTVATAGSSGTITFNNNSIYINYVAYASIAIAPASGTSVGLAAGSFTLTGYDADVDDGTPKLGRWIGSNTSLTIPTSWGAPNGLFPTEDRNDNNAYSFNSSTSTLTLPSADLADGYLIRASVEIEDTVDSRSSIAGKIVQASGTGTFAGPPATGYCRNLNDDRAYVACWAFVDGPSAAATFQFQWEYTQNEPGGDEIRSTFEVIPLYYDDVGVYTSTSTDAPGGTTPTQMTGFTGTDGTDITISSNTVTMAADNATYLILGGYYHEGVGGRTQRWGGLRIDGTWEDAAKAYSYHRFTGDGGGGAIVWLEQTATANKTVDLALYSGDGTANYEGGAESDENTTGVTAGDHALVVIQLPADAKTFRATGSTDENIATLGPVDLSVSKVADVDWADSGYFARASDTAMDYTEGGDVLTFANIGAASGDVTSTQRFTAAAEVTVGGTELTRPFHGAYLRGDQSTNGTFGWGANICGVVEATAGDDVGISVTERTSSEGGGGNVRVNAGWLGFGGIDLLSLMPSGSTPVALDAGSFTVTGNTLGLTTDALADLASGAYALTGQTLGVAYSQSVALDAGSYALTGLDPDIDLVDVIALASGAFSLTGHDLAVTRSLTFALDAGAYSLTGYDTTVTETVFAALDAGSFTLSGPTIGITVDLTAALAAGAYTLTGHDATLTETTPAPLDAGAFTWTGYDASLTVDAQIAFAAGSFTWTGYDLGITTVGETPVPLEAGSYALSGYAASAALDRAVDLDAGSYALSGGDADVTVIASIPLDAGSFGLTGHDLAVELGVTIDVELDSGTFTVTGYDTTLTRKQITGRLVSCQGAAQANLTNLSWAWFDATDPVDFGAPTDQGEIEITDSGGAFTIEIPGTSLVAGQTGTLVIRSDDGAKAGMYNLEVA